MYCDDSRVQQTDAKEVVVRFRLLGNRRSANLFTQLTGSPGVCLVL
jgi:hypothetical protein